MTALFLEISFNLDIYSYTQTISPMGEAMLRICLPIFMVCLLTVVIATDAMAVYAQLKSRISPTIEASGRTFDEARLSNLARQHFSQIGIEGQIKTEETYLITLGQWFTLNEITSNVPDGYSRDMPIYILKATGKFHIQAMPGVVSDRVEQDRVIVALFADSGQFLGHRSYGEGAKDLLIHVEQPDNKRVLIANTLIPLDKGEPTPMPYPPVVAPEDAQSDELLPVPLPPNP